MHSEGIRVQGSSTAVVLGGLEVLKVYKQKHMAYLWTFVSVKIFRNTERERERERERETERGLHGLGFLY